MGHRVNSLATGQHSDGKRHGIARPLGLAGDHQAALPEG